MLFPAEGVRRRGEERGESPHNMIGTHMAPNFGGLSARFPARRGTRGFRSEHATGGRMVASRE